MEDLEQIMRKIHILFAKCEVYGKEKDNKIIVPKKEVFRLLQELNYAVMNLMDQYEGTEESRERGLGEYRRKGQKIIEEAQAGAEDIYAASLVYTDNMINGLEDVLSEAKESLRLEYARMAKRLNEQAMMLETNQVEIKEQLLAMSQGEKYLNLILRENRRRQMMEEAGYEEAEEEELEEEDWEEDDGDEDDDGEEDAEENPEEIEDEEGAEDGETTEDEGNMKGKEGTEDEGETEDEETAEDKEKTEDGVDAEDKGGIEDRDATENENSKDGQSIEAKERAKGKKAEKDSRETNGGQRPEQKAGRPNGKKKKGGQKPGGSKSGKTAAKNKKRVLPDLEKEWEEEQKQRSARKVGTALYQDVGQPYDLPPKKVSYEIKVNEAYFEQLGEGNIDLDAEYEQWKKEQEGKTGDANGEGAAEDTAATVDQAVKKEKRRWFSRRKS